MMFPRAARVALLTAMALCPADRENEFLLWPTGAPGSERISAPEVSEPSANPANRRLPGSFTVTHYPSVYAFLPPVRIATGAALLVAPGNSHSRLLVEKEGWKVAEWLNAHGIAAFVLKYRIPDVPGGKYTLPGEVYADAARSVRLVRSRAKAWGIDPKRIGFIGFSGSGEVAEMIATRFDAGKPRDTDPVERVSSRPDFVVLACPNFRPGSLLGRTSRQQQPATPSPLSPNTPPVFMVCANNDPHVLPTVDFFRELQASHIPAEMHIYPDSAREFSLPPDNTSEASVQKWPDRLMDWLADRGFSKRQSP